MNLEPFHTSNLEAKGFACISYNSTVYKNALMIYRKRWAQPRQAFISRQTSNCKLLRSSMGMRRIIFDEFLSRLKVCLTGQIYPCNYTVRANHANKFPQRRQALKKQTKGGRGGEKLCCNLFFPLSGRNVSQGVHICDYEIRFKFNVRYLAAMF